MLLAPILKKQEVMCHMTSFCQHERIMIDALEERRANDTHTHTHTHTHEIPMAVNCAAVSRLGQQARGGGRHYEKALNRRVKES